MTSQFYLYYRPLFFVWRKSTNMHSRRNCIQHFNFLKARMRKDSEWVCSNPMLMCINDDERMNS